MKTLLERLQYDNNPNPLKVAGPTLGFAVNILNPLKLPLNAWRAFTFTTGLTTLTALTVGSKALEIGGSVLSRVGVTLFQGGFKSDAVNQQNTLGNSLDQILHNLNSLMIDVSRSYEVGRLKVWEENRSLTAEDENQIKSFDPVSNPEDFKKYFLNVQEYLTETAKHRKLTPFEQNASTITIDRMRDVILYGKNRHMYSNWADTLCGSASISYTDNGKDATLLNVISNPGRYLLRTDAAKNIKQFLITTDRVFNRNLDAPLDWIPLIIRRPEDLMSWKKIARMVQISVGALFGNNGKGENVNSILYSDLTVDASAQEQDKTYDPSLVFNYCWDMALNSMENIFTHLEEQKKLFNKAKETGEIIPTSKVMYRDGETITDSFGKIESKPNYGYLTINNIYYRREMDGNGNIKDNAPDSTDYMEFNQKKALMFVQTNAMISSMDERTGMRIYKGLDNKTMMLTEMVVARINEMIDAKGYNFTGLSFFDRNGKKYTRPENESESDKKQHIIPIEQVGLQNIFAAENEDEKRFLTVLVERLVRGGIQEGYNNMAFARDNSNCMRISTDKAEVNAHLRDVSNDFRHNNPSKKFWEKIKGDLKPGNKIKPWEAGYGLFDEEAPLVDDTSANFPELKSKRSDIYQSRISVDKQGNEHIRRKVHILKRLSEGATAATSDTLYDYIEAKKIWDKEALKNNKKGSATVIDIANAKTMRGRLKNFYDKNIKYNIGKALAGLMLIGGTAWYFLTNSEPTKKVDNIESQVTPPKPKDSTVTKQSQPQQVQPQSVPVKADTVKVENNEAPTNKPDNEYNDIKLNKNKKGTEEYEDIKLKHTSNMKAGEKPKSLIIYREKTGLSDVNIGTRTV